MNLEYGLNSKTINKIRNCLSQFPNISSAILYGSRAMGNYNNGSDIDLSLVGDISRDNLYKIIIALDDLMLFYTIDTNTYGSIDNVKLIDHIDKQGKCFYLRNNFKPQ